MNQNLDFLIATAATELRNAGTTADAAKLAISAMKSDEKAMAKYFAGDQFEMVRWKSLHAVAYAASPKKQ